MDNKGHGKMDSKINSQGHLDIPYDSMPDSQLMELVAQVQDASAMS